MSILTHTPSVERSPVTSWADRTILDKRNAIVHLLTKQDRSALPCWPSNLSLHVQQKDLRGTRAANTSIAVPCPLLEDTRECWLCCLWFEGVPCFWKEGVCLCTVANLVQSGLVNFRNSWKDPETIWQECWGIQSWGSFSALRCLVLSSYALAPSAYLCFNITSDGITRSGEEKKENRKWVSTKKVHW